MRVSGPEQPLTITRKHGSTWKDLTSQSQKFRKFWKSHFCLLYGLATWDFWPGHISRLLLDTFVHCGSFQLKSEGCSAPEGVTHFYLSLQAVFHVSIRMVSRRDVKISYHHNFLDGLQKAECNNDKFSSLLKGLDVMLHFWYLVCRLETNGCLRCRKKSFPATGMALILEYTSLFWQLFIFQRA